MKCKDVVAGFHAKITIYYLGCTKIKMLIYRHVLICLEILSSRVDELEQALQESRDAHKRDVKRHEMVSHDLNESIKELSAKLEKQVSAKRAKFVAVLIMYSDYVYKVSALSSCFKRVDYPLVCVNRYLLINLFNGDHLFDCFFFAGKDVSMQ